MMKHSLLSKQSSKGNECIVYSNEVCLSVLAIKVTLKSVLFLTKTTYVLKSDELLQNKTNLVLWQNHRPVTVFPVTTHFPTGFMF